MTVFKNEIRARKRTNMGIFKGARWWLREPFKMLNYRDKLRVFYVGPVVIEVGPDIL